MIVILTGPVHHGKTSTLKRLAAELRDRGVDLDGFLSESRYLCERIDGYDLFELSTDRSFPFIRRGGQSGWERIGPFSFVPETMERARRIIRRRRDFAVCIVDEIGPLELKGGGLWPDLKESIAGSEGDWLLVVREGILSEFRAILGREAEVLDIREFDVETRLKGLLRRDEHL